MPTWSLLTQGRKQWSFFARTEHETGVAIGDEFRSSKMYEAVVEPGQVIVFNNGHMPHATRAVEGETNSLHGNVRWSTLEW